VTTVFITTLHDHLCSADRYLIVLSPTAPNSSYEEIDLNVIVEYSGPQLIKSSVPLRFRYAGNPDIDAIRPKRIKNTYVFTYRLLSLCINVCKICSRPYEWLYYDFLTAQSSKGGLLSGCMPVCLLVCHTRGSHLTGSRYRNMMMMMMMMMIVDLYSALRITHSASTAVRVPVHCER